MLEDGSGELIPSICALLEMAGDYSLKKRANGELMEGKASKQLINPAAGLLTKNGWCKGRVQRAAVHLLSGPYLDASCNNKRRETHETFYQFARKKRKARCAGRRQSPPAAWTNKIEEISLTRNRW